MISFLLCFLFHYCPVTASVHNQPVINQPQEVMLGGSGDPIFSGAGDGYVGYNTSLVWATTHDASVGLLADYTSINTFSAATESLTGNIFSIYRTFLPFDTSAIPAEAVITSATLSIYPTSVSIIENDLGENYLGVVQTTQANSTILSNTDYNECGATTTPTLGATMNLVDMTANAYNIFTLNSTGLTWIKKNGETSSCGTTAGVTCLGLRTGHDIDNVTPTQFGTQTIISTLEDTSGNYPYLTITYYVPEPTGKLHIKSNTIQIKSGVLQIKN